MGTRNTMTPLAKKLDRQQVAKDVLYYLFLTGMAIAFLLPLYFMVVTAVKPLDEVYGQPFRWLPSEFQFENFVNGWTAMPFTRYLYNTLIIVVGAVTGAVISISMTAYALARINFPARSVFFALIIGAMLLPSEVRFVPEFVIWSNLGFVNTFVPLIAPSWLAQGEAKIFLLRQLFRGLPSDLEAAAKIDGASPIQRFTLIALPNAKAGIGIVLLLEFVTNWNKFIDPLIYLKEEHLYTLNVGLNMFRDLYSAAVFGVENIHWFMAIATLIVLPILAIFLLLQRFFIEGIHLTGMKG